ncbi:MAG TPA: c-type cytochrome [Burkholderiaceae bacterium]|jgi:cytochrome c553
MKNPSHPWIVAAVLATAPALVTIGARAADDAPTAAALRTRSLAATCAACHGSDGRAPEAATLPGLAGVPKDLLIEQMKAFKSGTRPGTVMPQIAKGYSDAQIEQLAAWFSKAAK